MLSGMTNPGEVLGFLDWSGVWSPDLIGVLGSAVLVSLIGFQFARCMDKPWFEAEFPALPRKSIDRPLLMGALLFGVGWGLAGYFRARACRSGAGQRGGARLSRRHALRRATATSVVAKPE